MVGNIAGLGPKPPASRGGGSGVLRQSATPSTEPMIGGMSQTDFLAQLPKGGDPMYGNPYSRWNPGTQSYGLDQGRMQQDYTNSFAPYFSASMANNALGFASIGASQANDQAQYGFANQGRNISRGSLQTQFDLGQRNLGIDQATLGLRRQQNMMGLEGNQIDREHIGQQRGFAQRGLDMDLAEQMRRGLIDIRTNEEDAQTRGGFFAPGTQRANQDILAATRASGDRSRLGYDETIAGLGAREKKLGLDDRQVKIADQILGQQAAQLGIQGDQLRAKLNEGLARLGLEGQIDAQQLVYGQAKGNIATQELYQKIINEALGTMSAQDPVAGSVYRQFAYGGF
jgi:hypothetical protein